MQNEIGEFVVGRIRGEARRGKPLNEKRKYPRLKASTKEQRERLSKFNKTHPSFRAPFSNTTITGQLLDAVAFEFARDVLKVFIDDTTRKPYKTGPNTRQKDPPNNEELSKFLSEMGFVIFNKKGIKKEPKIQKRIKTIVLRTLRRALRVAERVA